MSEESFIAWHGSPHTFYRFNFSKSRDALGVFFTESREASEYYGMARQYRLSFRNVLRVQEREISALSALRDFLLPVLMNGQVKIK